MRFCLRAVAVLMVIAVALPIVVGQPPSAGGPPQPALGGPSGPIGPQSTKPQLTVKVFKLEHGDPESVVLSLGSLLESPNAEVLPPMAWSGPPGLGVPGGFGALPPGIGFGGAPPLGGTFGFGQMPPSGAIGCFFGTGGTNAPPVWRATVQARTRAVVVRGSARHLAVAADLVALHDRPADAPLPKLQVIKVFELKHATAEELTEVIDALSFEGVKLAAPGEHLLALIASDDVTKSITELVKELDVPSKGNPPPKPKEPKPNEQKQ